VHRATPQFWTRLDKLNTSVQKLAHKNYALLKQNSKHPSLHFKKVGKVWSARVGINFRAIAIEDGSDYIWVWIGSHDEYEQFLKK
jgi:hypothetical protein